MAIARKRAKLFRREYHDTRGLTFALALRPRLQAPGVPILLRLTTDGGLATAPASGPGEAVAALAPEEIETLARMEHARWNAERWLAGWTFAPGEKNAARKTSPWLVDYDALPDAIREYDREAVRNIPRLVQLSGRKIVRGA